MRGSARIPRRRPSSIVTVSDSPLAQQLVDLPLERLDAPGLFLLLVGLLVEMRLLLLQFVQEQDVERFVVDGLRQTDGAER